MQLLEEIRDQIVNLKEGKYTPIRGLKGKNRAWLIKYKSKSISAFFEVSSSCEEFFEKFRSIEVKTHRNDIDNIPKYGIMLECKDFPSLREVFPSICEDFVRPANRKTLVSNPVFWCDSWKQALGNNMSNRNPGQVIAELLVMLELKKTGNEFDWRAVAQGTHDIVCDKIEIEVKSSIKRDEKNITISSQNQLLSSSGQPLFIAFLGFEEENRKGKFTINNVAEQLVLLNYDEALLEEGLEFYGYRKGNPERTRRRYNLLESDIQCYAVDATFPKITPESFKNGSIPIGVKKIEYTLDLSSNILTKIPLKDLLDPKRKKGGKNFKSKKNKSTKQKRLRVSF